MSVPDTVVVMGVCGCGKSSVGRLLAEKMGAVFEDADDFHPAANKAKMSAGTPLTDQDRWPWFGVLRERIERHRAEGQRYVLACSALKAVYRDWLRGSGGGDSPVFVLLNGPREVIRERMEARTDHFMPPALLDSQLATLEVTPDLLKVSIEADVVKIVEAILSGLKVRSSDAKGLR